MTKGDNNILNTESYKTVPDQDELLTDRKKMMYEICHCLVQEPFIENDAKTLIKEYLTVHKRFLYSIVSDSIFKLDNDQRPTYLANTEKLLLNCSDENKDSILKLYDHANLAVNQFSSLKQSEEEFNTRFGDLFSEKINPIIEDNKKSLQRHVKEVEQQVKEVQDKSENILNQLISIVSIFTAVAFIVFGGITSLSSVFNGIGNTSITKLCMLGSIWGLCLLNLIALFMHFINVIINSKQRISIHKEKFLLSGNSILLYTLFSSTGIYFITNYTSYWRSFVGIYEGYITGIIIAIIITPPILYVVVKKIHSRKKKDDQETPTK